MQAPALSQALAEPTVHVRGGWIAGLGLASLGMWMASLTPLQVSMPQQLQDITPHHKVLALSLVSAAGAVAAVVATPVAGALSDRTTGALGFGLAARPPPPLDHLHGPARRRLPGAHRAAGLRDRHSGPVGAVQRLPERRVRQPVRRDPRPRAGPPARDGGRLGRHAAGARPGRRDPPGRAGLHPGHAVRADRRLPGPGRAAGGAGRAVRRLHPGLPAGPRPRRAADRAQAAVLDLDQPAGVPGLRLGLADPVPGLAGHRHGHAVPAVLPARRGPLPPPGGRPARADRDLHRLRRRDGDRGRDDLRPGRQPQGHRHASAAP